MNEENRKNEIRDDELESVSGGAYTDAVNGASAFPIKPHVQQPEFQDAIIQETSGGI